MPSVGITKQRRQIVCRMTGWFATLIALVLGLVVLTGTIDRPCGIKEARAQQAAEQPKSDTPPTLTPKADQGSDKEGKAAKNEAGKGASKPEQPPIRANTRYSWESIGLAVLSILFLAFLFQLLIKWSQRIEHASYLGNLYKESIEEIEYQRLAYIPNKKLEKGDYIREISRDEVWLEKHKPPEIPPEINDISEDPFFTVSRRSGYAGYSGTGPPGSSGRPSYSSTSPPGFAASTPPSEEEQKRWDRRQSLLDDYYAKKEKWDREVLNEVERRYQEDLRVQRQKAHEKAERAVDIDLTVLRGRTPAFILEFTAVVVIIFAAVILGILDILKSEQIGTLLAAIAGYVLGRATSRGSSEASPTPKPKTETPKPEGKPEPPKG